MQENKPLLELDQIDFSYGPALAVMKKLSLSVAEGESLVLLGANGCGKSTLLKVLGGLLFARQGEFTAFDRTITAKLLTRDPFGIYFRASIGMLFQNSDAQLFNPTVAEEIAFGPQQFGDDPADVEARVETIMDQLSITHLKDRNPFALSGGEKRKVAIASILVMTPQVLLLDEPTTGLDARSSRILLNMLLSYRSQGKTLVTATHDLHIVPELASRVIVVGEDRSIIADDTATKILGNHELLHRANLIHFHTAP